MKPIINKILFAFSILLMSSNLVKAQVSGTVFRDYNGNGVKNNSTTFNEVFLPGVVVKAYGPGEVPLTVTYGGGGAATNTALGTYNVAGGTLGKIRLEFILPATDINATNGSAGGTTTMFPAGATQNLAVNINGDYTQANPFFVTPKNASINSGPAGAYNTQLKFPYAYTTDPDGNVNGTSTFTNTPYGTVTYTPNRPAPSTVATLAQVGTTWGLAYDYRTKKLYSATYIKRGTRLATVESTGAIYMTTDAVTPVAPSVYVDLNTVFGANTCGVNPHPFATTNWATDLNTITPVGKVGLGDIDISKDGTKLYVVNLADRQLYVIPTTGALNSTTILRYPISTAGLPVVTDAANTVGTAAAADIRPFGIGVDRNGDVFVGAVNSCESISSGAEAVTNNASYQMRAYVWKFVAGTFTLVLNNSLRFDRDGNGAYTTFDDGGATNYSTDWEPWSNVDALSNQQPMLADIDFFDDKMVLGFRDRGADQNYDPNSGGGFLSSGDIYLASQTGATYTMESAGVSGGLTAGSSTAGGTRVANGQGPGGGEFFEDTQGDGIANSGQGGLIYMPGYGVVSTVTDAAVRTTAGAFMNNAGAAGVQVYDITNGNYKGAYDAYYGNSTLGDNTGAFAKASGLGDLEILKDAAPIEIGNRVWNDANGDGIQSPGEAGISGVALEIFADFNNDGIPDGAALGTATTNAAGEWYFNNTNIADGDPSAAGNQIGLKPNSTYIIRPAAAAWAAGVGAGALAGYSLTKTDVIGAAGVQNWSDNDAALTGSGAAAIPQIIAVVGDYGENNHTFDIGFKQLASLGDRVWLDEGAGGGTRNNGIQDGTEPGVAGVAVTLYQNGPDGIAGNSDDVLIGSTITDAYGNYLFDNLQPSTNAATGYNVRVTPPANYVFSPQTNTTDDNNTTGASTTGSDVNALGVSYSVALSAGENNMNIDAGLVLAPQAIPNSIGDRVWLDQNNDGAQTAGEPGVAGVTVTLYDAAGNIYAITKTDANGNYLFNNLPANTNFTVGFGAPAGTVLVPTTAPTPGGTLSIGNSTLNSDPNPTTGLTTVINSGAPGTAITGVDAGLQNDPKGALGNFLWNDLNNNGIQDAGEPGIPGVTMKLYDPGPDGVVGGGDDILKATTTTDANGYYVFPSLDPGKYFVQAAPIAGYSISPKDAGTDDTKDSDFGANGAYPGNVSGVYTLLSTAGGVTRDMTVDMGVHSTAAGDLNTLGDKVWNDINKDGKQDAGEAGVPNVTVRLLDAAGAAVNNPATGKPYVVTTDANGNYKFVDLPDGNYIVEFANIPAGYSYTGQDADPTAQGAPGSATDASLDSDAKTTTGRTGIINLGVGTAGPVNLINVDGGISQGIPAGTASLGNRVWYDINNNGLQDAGELGVSNVKAELLDGTGAVVNVPGTSIPYVVYTNGLGEYLFTGLPAGDYTVRFSNFPVNFTASTANVGANASDVIDSDATFAGASTAATTATTGIYTLQTGEDNLTVDMGIVPNAATNSLGNFVWYDNNANGIQDATETGVPGVTVRLYTNGADGLPGTADDVLTGVTTTDANGAYSFVGLADGNYNVEFSGLPAGTKFTTQTTGTANGSDANPASGRTGTIALDPTSASATGINNPDVDAGITTTRASLGNYVWLDTGGGPNGEPDGVQDATEKGVSGVTVTLYQADGVTVVASTITDANGKYLFPNLIPGTYVVGFSSIPTNLSFTQANTPGDNGNNTNSDADPITGKTGPIVLIAGENDLTIDAGLKPNLTASVGNFVWFDKDGNGRQDAGEPGVPGILVTLKDNLGNVVGTAITDGNGFYLIDNVKPGTGFTITFSNLPTGSTFTGQNTALTNATNGSDANSAGVTNPFTLLPGQYLPDIDAGLQNVQILPIKIISFTALPKGAAVELNWNVAEQLDVNSYKVEHSSNGVNFVKTITTVTASATTNATYITTDATPVQGLNYYRIKVINKDGSIAYSEIRKVNFGKAGTFTIYPIPATDNVNITLPTSLIGKSATISILSVDGKLISKKQIANTGQTETVNVSSLTNGTYIVSIVTANEVVNKTIQVLR